MSDYILTVTNNGTTYVVTPNTSSLLTLNRVMESSYFPVSDTSFPITEINEHSAIFYNSGSIEQYSPNSILEWSLHWPTVSGSLLVTNSDSGLLVKEEGNDVHIYSVRG